MILILDMLNINNKWINLNFNRDINIYVFDFIDEIVIMWGVFVIIFLYKDCMKLFLVEFREILLVYRNDFLCIWYNSVFISDCGGNMFFCVFIKSVCYIWRRKLCFGLGFLIYFFWLNIKSLG